MYYLTTYFNVSDIVSKINNCKIWLAHYTENDKLSNYSGHYDIWQYTDKGQLNGIDGNVDMDIIYF